MRALSNGLFLEQQKAGATPYIFIQAISMEITPRNYNPPQGTWVLVTDATELLNMTNDLTANYRLANDIDAGASSGWDGGAGFTPVGADGTPFTGRFDGNGFTIKDLFIDRNANYQGLFGYADGASIYDVTFTGADITGAAYTGALIGRIDGGLVHNCRSSGTVESGSATGGLIGRADAAGESITINNCWSDCVITGGSFSGGLVGYTDSDGNDVNYRTSSADGNVTVSGESAGGLVGWLEVDNGATLNVLGCFANGDVSNTGDYQTGGFAGTIVGDAVDNKSSVDWCYATGALSVNDNRCGGFVGGSEYTVFKHCYAIGSLATTANIGSLYTGGFSGQSYKDDFSDCYSTVSITDANDNDTFGGFAGDINNSTFTRCYATGDITTTGSADTGGFIGWDRGDSTCTDCFARGDVTSTDGKARGFGPANDGSVYTNCYSTGAISSGGDTWGCIGDSGGSAVSCYWDTETSGISDTTDELATGKTTPQMKTEATFVDWDFLEVWHLDSERNDGYPFFWDLKEFTNRLIGAIQWEHVYDDGAEILLDNSDEFFSTKLLEGARITLGFGFKV